MVGWLCISIGRISAADFLARFTSFSEAFNGKRAAVEDYFDAVLKVKERKEQLRAAPMTVLGLLGAVGHFGLSIRDKPDPTAAIIPEASTWYCAVCSLLSLSPLLMP